MTKRLLSIVFVLILFYEVCIVAFYMVKEPDQKFFSSDNTTKNTFSENTRRKLPDSENVMKKVALTFDDGPHPSYTEQLLDGLKERGVVATFFVIGENASAHPELLKRMQEEGHLIGNHTYSHVQLRKNNRKAYGEEIVATNEVIRHITGMETTYIRPPYGTWDKVYERKLNMIPVLWTVDPLDWCSQNSDRIVEKVISKTKENDIILLHDIYESSVTAALKIVDVLQEKGYRFVTVEELLFD